MSTKELLAPSQMPEVRYIHQSFRTIAHLIAWANVWAAEWDLVQVVDVGGMFRYEGIFKKKEDGNGQV